MYYIRIIIIMYYLVLCVAMCSYAIFQGTPGWIRAGYTELKDNESCSVTEIEKSRG